jgi:hypothetical protein
MKAIVNVGLKKGVLDDQGESNPQIASKCQKQTIKRIFGIIRVCLSDNGFLIGIKATSKGLLFLCSKVR